MTNEEREALIAQGWTPPKVVDPDLIKARKIAANIQKTVGLHDGHIQDTLDGENDDILTMRAAIAGIKRGRELERAVMGNPIPEQIQEVTPPEPVNPDLAEAEAIWFEGMSPFDLALEGIKRGRALAAAEAKPGMIWVKHDGSEIRPVSADQHVWVRSFGYPPYAAKARNIAWQGCSHYAIITPPTEDAA